jgi:hypothetical protein
MALSQHEINLLVRFAEKNFKNLPLSCLLLFKEEPKVPGYGNVLGADDMLTMKVSLSVSLGKAFEIPITDDDELAIELADSFAQEYSMHISDLILELMTNKEDCVRTTVAKLIRYAKMERHPTIITSPTVGAKFVNEPGFVLSNVTAHDIESNYFYELGRIKDITVVVDPLMENQDYTYLITGNIIDYRMVETDEESFITYQLSEDGNDLLALFKPVVLHYRVDATGGNYKFFSIKDDEVS